MVVVSSVDSLFTSFITSFHSFPPFVAGVSAVLEDGLKTIRGSKECGCDTCSSCWRSPISKMKHKEQVWGMENGGCSSTVPNQYGRLQHIEDGRQGLREIQRHVIKCYEELDRSNDYYIATYND